MPFLSAPSVPLTRRDLMLGVSALAALVVATPYLARPMLMTADDSAPLIDAISEILLPGSLATAPGHYIASVLPTAWRGLTLDHVQRVSLWLNRHAQGDFLSISIGRRFAALDALDTATFDGALDAGTAEGWAMLKRALLTAFYTSEKGGAGDLAFNLVPGRWDYDIPLAQAPHPLSNDWLAIWFS